MPNQIIVSLEKCDNSIRSFLLALPYCSMGVRVTQIFYEQFLESLSVLCAHLKVKEDIDARVNGLQYHGHRPETGVNAVKFAAFCEFRLYKCY